MSDLINWYQMVLSESNFNINYQSNLISIKSNFINNLIIFYQREKNPQHSLKLSHLKGEMIKTKESYSKVKK